MNASTILRESTINQEGDYGSKANLIPQYPQLTTSLHYNIYVDGACKEKKEVVGGYIVAHKKILLSWSICIGICPTADYAESRSIYEGLIRSKQLGISAAQLHADSQLLWTKWHNLSTLIDMRMPYI